MAKWQELREACRVENLYIRILITDLINLCVPVADIQGEGPEGPDPPTGRIAYH